MKIKLKKMLIMLLAAFIFVQGGCIDSFAKKKKKKKNDKPTGISEAEVKKINASISSLTKKVYALALFSPEDNANLVELKFKLDDAMEASDRSPVLAKLYYNAGYVYMKREYKELAIQCFQSVLMNFPTSTYARRAKHELKQLGIEPEKKEEHAKEHSYKEKEKH